MTSYRVSADIGGTFTDFVFEDGAGGTQIGKVPTTPQNPSRGVLDGLAAGPCSFDEIDFFVHGTTVGLNAFLERRGARTLLLMTAGISDGYLPTRLLFQHWMNEWLLTTTAPLKADCRQRPTKLPPCVCDNSGRVAT